MMLAADKFHKTAFFIDFDGTVTDIDVVDGILERYSPDKKWTELEKEWAEGRMSSGECMTRQLERIQITEEELESYLASVRLDEGFAALKEALLMREIPFIILSDGFDLFIRKILELNGHTEVPFRANHLEHRPTGFKTDYPYSGHCDKCAHCKRFTLMNLRPSVKTIIFIGDGLSDRCAAQTADIVYAKDKLASYCREAGKDFRPYRHLSDIVAALPGMAELR